MRIKAQILNDSFEVEADEQKMIIPRPFFSRFVSVVESAYYRYIRSVRLAAAESKKAKYEELKAKIEAAGHPDVLPFIEEQTEPGRPKGSGYDLLPEERITKKKLAKEKKQKEPEPPPKPFKHEKFV